MDQFFYDSLLGSLSPEPMDDVTVRVGIELYVKVYTYGHIKRRADRAIGMYLLNYIGLWKQGNG